MFEKLKKMAEELINYLQKEYHKVCVVRNRWFYCAFL